MSEELKRRDILKFGAGTVLAARVALAQEHKFFTAEEFAMVDELSEIIIPTDDHSPGAKAAKVADFIDQTLAEAFDDQPRQQWRSGLAVVNQISQKLNGTSFVKATAKQRAAVVLQMAGNEKKPVAPEEIFFGELKGATTRAYYTTDIGIHKELDYKGKVLQTGQYAGILPSGPALGESSESSK